MTTLLQAQEREVIKLVQRIDRKGLVSLKVYHFENNEDWLLTYRPGVAVTPIRPDSLLFAYTSPEAAAIIYQQFRSQTRVDIEAWRAITTAWSPFPADVQLTNRIHRWSDYWQWYAEPEQGAVLPFTSCYTPEPGTVLCRDLKLIGRIEL